MEKNSFPPLYDIIQKIPDAPGVYIMKNQENHVLYIGKAKSLKNRVRSYFQTSIEHIPKIAKMVCQVENIEFLETRSEIEALVLEARFIRELQPKYNTRQKDSKSYPYFVITKEDYPRCFIGREGEYTSQEDLDFYGPFIDALSLKKSFKILQKTFRFRTCHLNLKKESKKKFRPCLLFSVKYCSAPCAEKISHKEYLADIASLRKFLEGNANHLLAKLEKEMQCASEILDFEKAAKLRDQVKSLKNLDKKATVPEDIPDSFFPVPPQESLKKLKEILNMGYVPRIIEGIDIAHHAGKEAVGSLVTFIDGIPAKEGYRRYKIQSLQTTDDYAMLKELVYRRFSGNEKKKVLPDILLVDGGKGQLHTVQKALKDMNIQLGALLSLAKQNEEIYIPGQDSPLALSEFSIVHHLLCHIRDEAHRFAQSYHHFLKSKKIKKQE